VSASMLATIWGLLEFLAGTPAIGAEGSVYFGIVGNGGPPGDGTFYAVRPNGSEKWRFTTDGGVLFAPTIGPDATIYVGTANGRLYAIR